MVETTEWTNPSNIILRCFGLIERGGNNTFCKINYILNTYNLPFKYTNIVFEIKKLLNKLNNININIKFHWIPGHTNNKWNDKADFLAKAAAKSWTPPNSRAHLLDGTTTVNVVSS